ncbi:TAFII28-domain-containing protein [Mycena maculata]|uniref:TAFII28-domain-containing protein n=1 Tax=Mycena maculata TaxID=230809 RepID=A0AAD7MNE4_9AGAR|nr:TAFII28-domain-containing protein [Mycena maculata]
MNDSINGSYFSPAQSPNPGGYSPAMNAPSPRGRPRGGSTATTTGAKRGPKPGGSSVQNSPAPSTPQFLPPTSSSSTAGEPGSSSPSLLGQGGISANNRSASNYTYQTPSGSYSAMNYMPAATSYTTPAASTSYSPMPNTSGLIGLSGAPIVPAGAPPPSARPAGGVIDEDAEDDELLPAMADDDYSAQLSWQSQSKDNLRVLMENLSPAQYERFEAYRRHALPKQAVRKVIQQAAGLQVSLPVAQIVAGFSKVFVGEIVEKARAVQARRGDTGPLSPDHLREAYRMYQDETGRVGAARPLRSKKLFVK